MKIFPPKIIKYQQAYRYQGTCLRSHGILLQKHPQNLLNIFTGVFLKPEKKAHAY